ncbi:MAG: calcium-binding protein [Paracoccus sp. (in: a-proteobacteria)]
MAILIADQAFDQSRIDFSPIVYDSYGTDFWNNSFLQNRGTVYEDTIFEFFYTDAGMRGAAFAGTGLNVNVNAAYTSGRINLYLEQETDGTQVWEIYGIDLDARDVYAAMETTSRADDQELIRRALSGNDTFYLSDQADRANGLGGNDTLFGFGGNDTLGGGAGNDQLYGDGGDDWLLMDSGNDTLDGGPGRDWVSLAGEARAARIDLAVTVAQDTGYGRDVIVNVENLHGGMGHDTLLGNAQDNVIRGGMGNDRILGRQGNDRLEGNQGNDYIEGGLGSDTLIGGLGNDTLLGGPGNDWIHLDAGDDVIRGGEGRDWLVAGAAAATVDLTLTGRQNTGYGNDLILGMTNIQGGAGADRFFGNAQDNVIRGGMGNDRIFGRQGNDWLEGNQGDDLIDGGLGNDTLLGGLGNDTLVGGPGLDRLTGGPGADIFVFRALDHTSADAGRADFITDFQQGQDRIDLRDIDADTTRAGNDAFAFIGTDAFSGAGQLSYRQLDRPGTDNDVTQILLDVNGDGQVDGIIRLAGLHDLTANDFLL